MAGNLGAPDGGRTPDDPAPAAAEQAQRPRSGRVTELGLVAAGLGLVVYLLGFVDDAGLGAVVGPLLVGGGLLAGAVALPSASTRLLVPAAVSTVTGALFLLQTVAGGADSPFAIGALVLALLEAAAATGAALVQAGAVRAPKPKAVAAPPAGGYPHQLGSPGQQYPGQPYPGQPYPGSYAAPPVGGYPGGPPATPPTEQYPGDQFAGEHAYAQNARYGAQYGVPRYPPPPPYGAPVHDPAGPEPSGTGGWPARRRAEAPADGAPGEASARSADPTPASDAGGGATTVVHTAGVHRVRPSAGGEGGPEARDEPTTVVHGTGAHRARSSRGEPASGFAEGRDDPATAVQASGAHRASLFHPEEPRPAEPPVDAPASAGGSAAVAGSSEGGPDDVAEARTRAIPRVTDER